MQQCAGDGATPATITTYLAAPGTPGKILFDGNCLNSGITISSFGAANATLYFLQVFDGGTQIFNGLSATPSFNFIPSYVASYTVMMTASNSCGSGAPKVNTLNVIDCGGGGGQQQRMAISMSPNPAKDHIKVDLSLLKSKITQLDFDNSEMEIAIFSTKDGSQVFAQKTMQKSVLVDTKHMVSDRYIVRASILGEYVVQQFIVAH